MEGAKVYLHSFLISALKGGEWSTSRPQRFTPRQRTSAPTKDEAGWGPRDDLDGFGEHKNLLHLLGLETLTFQPVA